MNGHRNRLRFVLHALTAGAIAVASTLVGASPAHATMYEKFEYAGQESDSFPYCGLEQVQLEVEFSGKGHIRTGKGRLAGAFFLQDNYSVVETLRNPENGKYFTISQRGVYQDLKATPVGDSVFEFVSHEVGQPFVVRDMDGNVVFRDRGAITWTYLFDTEGDDEPGGDFLEELDVRVSGPHPAFFIEDECPTVLGLIG